MENRHILIVEDEKPIRDMLRFNLNRAGFGVSEAADASAARVAVADRCPDLVLLDWMLPGASGIQLTRELKADPATRDLPVIMVTARAGERDRVCGLDTGCDDYISKPFSTSELLARVRAVLRRARPAEAGECIKVGALVMDCARQHVSVGDEAILLGPTGYRLLFFLASNPQRVYTRGQLLDHVWGRNAWLEERTVDVHIGRLRKALSVHGYDRLLQTVRGRGYSFTTEP